MSRRACRVALPMLLLAAVALHPRPAAAWRYGWAYPLPGAPLALHPVPPPRPGYRYSLPSGAPLSYDDPGSGIVYCLSPSTGYYFICGYAAPEGPPSPAVPAAAATPGLGPASGLLLFRLPPGSEAEVDGVPVGLSQGLGVLSVKPGRYRVLLRASGTEARHEVEVRSHTVYTVTPAGPVPSAP
ncbi:MAG: hypothetical protein ACE147_14095 [Candidatus Methylomirabilales bacterium]